MSESWRIHTIVFDLDDTLFSERDFVYSGFMAVGEWLKTTHAIQGFEPQAKSLFDAGWRGNIFDEAVRRLGCEGSSPPMEAMVRAYRLHTPRIKLLADAEECLTWAGGRCHLAVLSDGYREVQRRKIAALHLEARVDRVVLTDELGPKCWKPSPRGYSLIMEAFGGAADGYVYVGDNPRKDFKAPKALGWRTVRIRRLWGEYRGLEPQFGEEADAEITVLSSLRGFIDLTWAEAHRSVRMKRHERFLG